MRTNLQKFALIAILFASAILLPSCTQRPQSLTIGTTASEVNSLLYLADEQGYFEDYGLDVTIKKYTSGKAAIDGMLHNEVDMATGTEYAFAGNVLAGDNVRFIGVIGRFTGEFLIARNDAGIAKLSDLKGKKIGVPMKSRPEFALGRFFELNGIDTSTITLVNISVDKSVNALVSGQVDAIATWQPYIDEIKRSLNNSVVLWSVQNDQASYNGIICTGNFSASRPKEISGVLKALLKAQNYYEKNGEATKTIIKRTLGLDDSYVAEVWQDYHFSVSLDLSLVLAMEDETRWMIKNNLTTSKQVPNFENYIYENALKRIKPGAVSIIR